MVAAFRQEARMSGGGAGASGGAGDRRDGNDVGCWGDYSRRRGASSGCDACSGRVTAVRRGQRVVRGRWGARRASVSGDGVRGPSEGQGGGDHDIDGAVGGGVAGVAEVEVAASAPHGPLGQGAGRVRAAGQGAVAHGAERGRVPCGGGLARDIRIFPFMRWPARWGVVWCPGRPSCALPVGATQEEAMCGGGGGV